MLKNILIILTIFVWTANAFSQDLTLFCGDKLVRCENGNKSHFEIVLDYNYKELDSTKLPHDIREKAREYLLKRVGIKLYSRLIYYSCQEVNNEEVNERRQMRKTSKKRIKYAIQYYFIVQDSMKYYLTIAFTEDGKIISKDQLPNINSNKQLDKIIKICEAKVIAEKDTITIMKGNAENFSLEYDPKINSFVWKVEKSILSARGQRSYRFSRTLYINAHNGIIVRKELTEWQNVCNHSDF